MVCRTYINWLTEKCIFQLKTRLADIWIRVDRNKRIFSAIAVLGLVTKQPSDTTRPYMIRARNKVTYLSKLGLIWEFKALKNNTMLTETLRYLAWNISMRWTMNIIQGVPETWRRRLILVKVRPKELLCEAFSLRTQHGCRKSLFIFLLVPFLFTNPTTQASFVFLPGIPAKLRKNFINFEGIVNFCLG